MDGRGPEAFDALKQALIQVSSLAFPCPTLTDSHCILDTEASDVAIGGVLSQIVDGVERPTAFSSRLSVVTVRLTANVWP